MERTSWAPDQSLISYVPAGRPLLLRTDMSNPDDDTDVPSGFNDDAEMERTPSRSSESLVRGGVRLVDEARRE